MNKTLIAPSILAADFRNLEKEFEKINHSASQWVHFDVMDGLNVPNISFGFPILEACRKLTKKYIDVHLMIEHPSRYFEEFQRKGADGLSVHYEKNIQVEKDLMQIRSLGMKSGLVVNPDTDVSKIEPYLEWIDVLLIMSVKPGFGGQEFNENTYTKVSQARKMIDDSEFAILLEVDGGVSVKNSKKLIQSGADILVCGSALFKANDFNEYVNQLIIKD